MHLGRSAASALAACASVMLAACVADAPLQQTAVLPAVAAAPPPPAGWQWNDTPLGPSVTLAASPGQPADVGTASLVLTCSDLVPAIAVTWASPVAASAFSYRFAGGPGHQAAAEQVGAQSQVVSDPVEISRFLDEASDSQQLTVSAGATQASFSTADIAGNLRRFRTVCPAGTN
jgi:hypothetical protein